MRRVLPLLLTATVACAAGGPTPQEVLEKTVFVYNEHLRWKRFDKASHFVTDKARADFMKAFEASEETLSIDDLEVKNLDYDEKKSTVTVNARYFKIPSVTLQKAKWVQVWERKGDDWWLVENPQGPFFVDPASKPAR